MASRAIESWVKFCPRYFDTGRTIVSQEAVEPMLWIIKGAAEVDLRAGVGIVYREEVIEETLPEGYIDSSVSID